MEKETKNKPKEYRQKEIITMKTQSNEKLCIYLRESKNLKVILKYQ